jgi:hypothetical protein
MDKQHRNTTSTDSTDMQQGHATWPCIIDMGIGHGHAAYTSNIDIYLGYATRRCNRTCSRDIKYANTA